MRVIPSDNLSNRAVCTVYWNSYGAHEGCDRRPLLPHQDGSLGVALEALRPASRVRIWLVLSSWLTGVHSGEMLGMKGKASRHHGVQSNYNIKVCVAGPKKHVTGYPESVAVSVSRSEKGLHERCDIFLGCWFVEQTLAYQATCHAQRSGGWGVSSLAAVSPCREHACACKELVISHSGHALCKCKSIGSETWCNGHEFHKRKLQDLARSTRSRAKSSGGTKNRN